MYYIACCSGGKDSITTIILAHEHNEPLDEIIFSEVMFDENISGELPEHIDFIKNKAFPLFESWGYKCTILHSDKTFMNVFNHIRTRGKKQGMKAGFPVRGRCAINRDCKVKPIHKYIKSLGYEVTQYIGIAKDEKERLERLKLKTNHISLLDKYNYTEAKAYMLCEQYDLLSPVYSLTSRGGVLVLSKCEIY